MGTAASGVDTEVATGLAAGVEAGLAFGLGKVCAAFPALHLPDLEPEQ